MSVLGRLLGSEQRDTASDAPSAQPADVGALHYSGVGGVEWAGGASGIGAMRFPAVFASIRVIAETISTLSLPVYVRTSDTGRRRLTADEDPRVSLLQYQPNPDQGAVEFFETLLGILCQRGRTHVWIAQRDRFGRAAELRALDPRGVLLRRDEDGTRYWQLGWDERSPRAHVGDVIPLSAFMGLSPITVCRQAVQLGITAQDYGARLWENDARPGSYLSTDKELSDAAYQRMLAEYESRHKGSANAGRVALLEGGVKWTDVGITPEDAQFLETRKFQTTEVARMFRLPPHKIGDLDRATFSNIEHQSIEYVQDSILPWCVRLEQRLKIGLFGDRRDRAIFPEFLLETLLRGDTATRYEAYAKAPWMADNEKRQREGLASLPGLDATYAPLNMSRIVNGEVVPPPAADKTAPAGGTS